MTKSISAIFQIRRAEFVDSRGQLLKLQRRVGVFGIRWAVGYAALSVWVPGLITNTRILSLFLITSNLAKVRLCSIGNTDHSVGLIVDYFAQFIIRPSAGVYRNFAAYTMPS